MSDVVEKLNKILDIIVDLKNDDVAVHFLMLEGFNLSVDLIDELKKVGSREKIDMSKHLEIITNVLGISLEELVTICLDNMKEENEESTKMADQETLDFITSDLDDYEKFLAKNSSKKDLEFLSKEI
jgi:oligoribonuclease (3'-5' exoribonuclease)